jgi:hypothetical protein
MWVIADYQPVALFSLKSALATSSGGKSLLVPTPFAIKMALLDAGFRVMGADEIGEHWSVIRDLTIAINLSPQVVVTNLFTKILKPRRGTPPAGQADAGPLQKSIGFREYVWPVGTWQLGLGTADETKVPLLEHLLLQINYLGKRGGFIQIAGPPKTTAELSEDFTLLNPEENQQTFHRDGLLQVLDDCGPKMTLEHANIYSGKRISMGRQRVLHHIVLPYKLTQSSRGYSLYTRISVV